MKRAAMWMMALVALTAAASALAAGKKVDTGRIEGNRYTDLRYGFSFQKHDNWKYGKVAQEDTAKPLRIRLSLTQRGYFIPAERRANQESFTPPALGLWVDTTSLSVDEFLAQVVDSRSKLKWRKDLAQVEPIIDRGNRLESGKIQIDGQPGVRQTLRMDYEAQVYDRAKDRYSVINDALIGDLFIVKHGGRAYVFYFRCERAVYPTIKDEVRDMILSMDFNPQADTTGAQGN